MNCATTGPLFDAPRAQRLAHTGNDGECPRTGSPEMAHTRLNPLLRWARARHRWAEGPDFGDHGTAFGLELTLAPAPVTVPADSTLGSPSPSPAPAPSRAAASPTPAARLANGARDAWRRTWREG